MAKLPVQFPLRKNSFLWRCPMCHNLFQRWPTEPSNNSNKLFHLWHLTSFTIAKRGGHGFETEAQPTFNYIFEDMPICQFGCFQHYHFQYLIKLGEILNSNSTLFQNLTFSLNFEYSMENIGRKLKHKVHFTDKQTHHKNWQFCWVLLFDFEKGYFIRATFSPREDEKVSKLFFNQTELNCWRRLS